MQKCTLTLITATDGRETRESHAAELELDGSSALLRYQDGPTAVVIAFSEGQAKVERNGDYAMRLPLKSGERTEGELSFGGKSGCLLVNTKRVEYFTKPRGFMFRFSYQLLFGEELQEMRVCGRASFNGEK